MPERSGYAIAGMVIGCALLLGACAHNSTPAEPEDAGIIAPPTDYKREILGAMHAYLNDPTGVRDASIAPPALKTVDGATRQVACLRFDAKQRGHGYAGSKEIAAVFLGGRFDHFVEKEKAKEPCADAAYAPFPELQKLSR